MDGGDARIPDGIEPLSAYRAWVFSKTDAHARLLPITSNGSRSDAWKGAGSGWVRAHCRMAFAHREVPAEDCSCGFYAVKELPYAIELASPRLPYIDDPEVGFVLGRVLLSGKVIEHGLGYRAQRARIAELIPFEGTERFVQALAERHGVGMAAAVRPGPRDLPSLAPRLRRPSPRPAPTAPDDAAWHVTAGTLAGLFLLTSFVLLFAGVWVPPLGVFAIAFLSFTRHASPMAEAYRGWWAQHRS